jgi:hypothetical protein
VRSITVVACAILLCAAPAYAGSIDLPQPSAGRAQELALVCSIAVGATPERCKASSVPGPVVNDEVVLVGLDGAGTPTQVQLEQRLSLTKVGDYVIRERGPARSAVALVADSDPPNTKLGAVVFQGFSPGRRSLGARLTLDAGLEAPRLPLGVSVTYAGGGQRGVGAGGQLPGKGTVSLLLTNRTDQPADLPTGTDADPAALAGPLDRALTVARGTPGPRLPSTDDLLPAHLNVSGPARRLSTQGVPLRVTGTVRLVGTQGIVSGPGTSALPDGAVIAGTLAPGTSTVQIAVQVDGPGRLVLALSVVPALDPRLLTPPRGLPTWAAWARGRPPLAERQRALDLLVATAATGARASSYSPYLGADLPGSGSTVFRYSFTAPTAQHRGPTAVQPKPGPIAVAGLALLLVCVNAALLWRRS